MSVIKMNERLDKLSHERVMSGAPRVSLPNGSSAIPQHYKTYHQTVSSLSAILSKIEFHSKVLLFTGLDQNGLYLQVGIVGHENYGQQVEPDLAKLVYGRKWRIDEDTPSTEVIQTAYLAIQKAREHEVREMLTLRNSGNKLSVPFSTHQDLSLMAKYQTRLKSTTNLDTNMSTQIEESLARIRFNKRAFIVDSVYSKRGKTFVDLTLESGKSENTANTVLPEFEHFDTTLILPDGSRDRFIFDLVETLIRQSNEFVSENFMYDGFARFSREYDPFAIADFSVASRPYKKDMKDQRFARVFEDSNFAVDASRVPHIGTGSLAQENLSRLSQFENLAGHMPIGYRQRDKEHASRATSSV